MTGEKRKFLGEVADSRYEGLDSHSQCVEEISSFLRGGVPGAARLKQVLSSVFTYFDVVGIVQREEVLRACGLQPCVGASASDVTFVFRGSDCSNQFKPPYRKRITGDDCVDEEGSEPTLSEA